MLKSKIVLASLSAVLSLASLTGSALAGGRVYTSAGCQEDGAGESGAFKRNEAVITRISAVGSGRLICPVVRDNVSSTSASARVTVTDWNPNGDVVCAISVRQYDGAPVGWKTKKSDGMSSTVQHLFIPAQQANADLPISIECTMPVNSGSYYTYIHNYRVDH